MDSFDSEEARAAFERMIGGGGGFSMQEQVLGPEAHQESIKHMAAHRQQVEKSLEYIDAEARRERAKAGLYGSLGLMIMILTFYFMIIFSYLVFFGRVF